MAEVKRRRKRLRPQEDAIQFCRLKKDKNGLDGRFINDNKGRGVFSCTEFDKGDFLLEYIGDLISKEECERRQRLYHDALKVFMFEFRYNGKLLCVDAARDDGSLGRLVNDDHINPNSRMKTICVDGKPHLCLFATRNICAGEEITYNYGDSEWPWRCSTPCKLEPPPLEINTISHSEIRETESCSEIEPSPLEINIHSLLEVKDVDMLTVVCDQSVSVDSSVSAASVELEKVTPKMNLLPSEDLDCVEKMSPVKEHVLNKKQKYCAPAEEVKEVCKHIVVPSAISSMDKCAECVGPVAALKWLGLKCQLCSSFWHKSCYLKLHEWDQKRSLRMRSK